MAGGWRRRDTDFMLGLLLVLSALAALLFGAIWFMSPLGLGFSAMSGTPEHILTVQRVFMASYSVGLPLLILTQFVAIWQATRRKLWYACLWSLLPLAALIAIAGWVTANW